MKKFRVKLHGSKTFARCKRGMNSFGRSNGERDGRVSTKLMKVRGTLLHLLERSPATSSSTNEYCCADESGEKVEDKR